MNADGRPWIPGSEAKDFITLSTSFMLVFAPLTPKSQVPVWRDTDGCCVQNGFVSLLKSLKLREHKSFIMGYTPSRPMLFRETLSLLSWTIKYFGFAPDVGTTNVFEEIVQNKDHQGTY